MSSRKLHPHLVSARSISILSQSGFTGLRPLGLVTGGSQSDSQSGKAPGLRTPFLSIAPVLPSIAALPESLVNLPWQKSNLSSAELS